MKGGKNMDAPKMHVKCGVVNCRFNKNHMCYAQSIEINAKDENKANTSAGTCCSTFIP